jgi:hypothetical protein
MLGFTRSRKEPKGSPALPVMPDLIRHPAPPGSVAQFIWSLSKGRLLAARSNAKVYQRRAAPTQPGDSLKWRLLLLPSQFELEVQD